MAKTDKIFDSLWEGLTPRQKEIVLGRFGLGKSSERQTLAALGDRYQITRERVRQIEASALQVLKKKITAHPQITELLARGKKFVQMAGGVIREEALLKELNSALEGLTNNHLALLLETSEAFYGYGEDEDFIAFYYSDQKALKEAKRFIDQLAKFLHVRKDDVLEGKYRDHFASFVAKQGIDTKHAESYVEISKRIHSNPYGDIGLRDWPEIHPSTIRDRIYLVLRKNKQPLHFEEIAQSINNVGFYTRKALVPTVHNELIKDSRFVLVGRGMYALAEFGYEPGTAKEVIHKVLKKKGALTTKEIISAVQEERFFRPNTVIANLQNKELFSRLDDGRYSVRES
jgi:predicted Zn-ribbon and HTH transcriptional regulator